MVNAIPNSAPVIPVINTSKPIEWFAGANKIYYTLFYQYSPLAGNDTVYVVQNTDTLGVGPKATGQMYYGILPFKKWGIYSLFLCGTDTTSPDYLFTADTLPYHGPSDSTVGIRFVNLSAGSNPININVEGSPNGSPISNLSYKGISSFENYICNSSVQNSNYTIVISDAVTGNTLLSLTGYWGGLGTIGYPGIGLYDPNTGAPLVFKNGTFAFIGQPGPNAAVPQQLIFIENY